MSRSSLHLDCGYGSPPVIMTWGSAPRDGLVQRRKDCGLCPWPSPFSVANDESWPPAAPPSTYGHLPFLCIHDGLHLQGSWHHHQHNQTSQFEARLEMGAAEWKRGVLHNNGCPRKYPWQMIRCSNLFIDLAVYYTYLLGALLVQDWALELLS